MFNQVRLVKAGTLGRPASRVKGGGRGRTVAGGFRGRTGRAASFLLLLCVSTAPIEAQDTEARRPVVRSLTFEGNRAIDDYALRLSVATSQSAWFARSPLVRWMGLGEKRYFDETEFRRDVLRVLALYRQSGFLDTRVDTVVRRTDGDVYLRMRVLEGEPVLVRSLEVHGIDSLLPESEWRTVVPLVVGEPFNRLRLQATADTIRARLADLGYPFAEVYRNFDVDREHRTADVRIEVDPGPRATVARIEVLGNDRIAEDVVRRSLAVAVGAPFRARDLYESQLELYRTDVFSYVNVALATQRPDSHVAVRVQVTEGALRRVRLGGGYGTVDCFRALGAWTVHDFLGGGRTLQVNARVAQLGVGTPTGAGFERSVCPALANEDTSRLKLNYNVTLSVREPFFLTRKASATVSLFAERRSEFQAYLREAVGGELAVTLRTAFNVPLTLSYGLSYGSTRADPATFCSFLNVCRVEDTRAFTETLVRSALTVTLVRDRRNSLLNPTRGSRFAAELRHASRAIGSDSLSQFTRGTVEFASHHWIGRRSTLSWRIKLGRLVPPELGLTGRELRFVPPEERFYAGGPNTVRGFGQNELGPVVRVLDTVIVREEQRNGRTVTVADSVIRASPVGGNDLIVANAEYRFPLPGFAGRLSGAVFVDAGRVFSSNSEDADAPGLRVTPGLGIRIASPLGPIRLDVAVNPYPVEPSPLYVRRGGQLELAPEPYSPERGFLGRFRIHFSVGQAY